MNAVPIWLTGLLLVVGLPALVALIVGAAVTIGFTMLFGLRSALWQPS